MLDGGDGTDTLLGDAGNDQLTGGSGVDGYAGGEGDDNLTAFDGLAESVDCGGGTDGAAVDVADTLANCENVRRLDEILDVDRDGSLPPQDCNDNNPKIRPGATDKPQQRRSTRTAPARTRIRDASRATVKNGWRFNDVVHAGDDVRRQEGAGGRHRAAEVHAAQGQEEGLPVQDAHAGVRERHEDDEPPQELQEARSSRSARRSRCRISKRNQIAKVVRYTTRSGKVPKTKTLCLAPGKKKPGKC